MNIEKIAENARFGIHKLVLRREAQIYNIYEEALKEIGNDIRRRKHISNSFLKAYKKQIKFIQSQMAKNLEAETIRIIQNGIFAAAEVNADIWERIEDYSQVNLNLGSSFFGVGNAKVLRELLKGNIYNDARRLDERIWKHVNEFGKTAEDIITIGIAQGKGSVDLAEDLQEFVKDKAKRRTDWKRCYPKYINRTVDYNAQRLARTSLNHAYQNATIESSKRNPFITAIQWKSALIHGRTCDLCKERDGQIFKFDEVPLDHPNGLCTMIPYIPKSLPEIGEELQEWAFHDKPNKLLDNWYKRYGDYFASKQYGA